MRLFVGRQVELYSPIDDKGSTLYSQLMSAKKQGIDDPLLEPVVVPDSATWILGIFWKLHKKRQYDGMSGTPLPTSYSEIYAFQQLERCRFSPFDLQALEAMEDEFFAATHKIKQGNE